MTGQSRMEIDPTQLMIKAKKGDKQAFDTLHAHYFVPVFRYVLKRVKHKQDAEDIAQTTFLKLYTSKTTFENQNRDPLAYLFTIARNATTDHWKKQGRKDEQPIDDSLPDRGEGLKEKIHKKLTINEQLTHLPDEQAEVIRLKFLQGYSNPDIANKLGKSEQAIRQIQCRALKKLRDITAYD